MDVIKVVRWRAGTRVPLLDVNLGLNGAFQRELVPTVDGEIHLTDENASSPSEIGGVGKIESLLSAIFGTGNFEISISYKNPED